MWRFVLIGLLLASLAGCAMRWELGGHRVGAEAVWAGEYASDYDYHHEGP